MVSDVEAHTRASSSTAMAWVTWSAPGAAVGLGDAEGGQLHLLAGLEGLPRDTRRCGRPRRRAAPPSPRRRPGWSGGSPAGRRSGRRWSRSWAHSRRARPTAVRSPASRRRSGTRPGAAARARRARSGAISGTQCETCSSTSKRVGAVHPFGGRLRRGAAEGLVPGRPDVERRHGDRRQVARARCRPWPGTSSAPPTARRARSAPRRTCGRRRRRGRVSASSVASPLPSPSGTEEEPLGDVGGPERVGRRPVCRLGAVAAQQGALEGEGVRRRHDGERAHPAGLAGGGDPAEHAAPVVARPGRRCPCAWSRPAP